MFMLHLFPKPLAIGTPALLRGQGLKSAFDDFGQVILVEQSALILMGIDRDPSLVPDEGQV